MRLTEIIERLSAALTIGVVAVLGLIVKIFGANPEGFATSTQFLLILLITAAASLILGLGLPATANYIVMATLIAPIIYHLGESFGYGIPLLAAHLFVFFFGILADDTPPVGLAAYAAAAIAKSDPIQTGIQGFMYDIRTAILPFMFVFNTKLLLFGVSGWVEGIWIFATALLGMLAFAAATQGFVLVEANWLERILLFAVAFLLIKPELMTDIAGIILIALIALWQVFRRNKQAGTASPA